MPYFAHHRRSSPSDKRLAFPSSRSLKDDTSQLYLSLDHSLLASSCSSSSSGSSSSVGSASSASRTRLEVPSRHKERSGSSESISTIASSLSSRSGDSKSSKKEKKIAKKREENEKRLRGLEGADQRRSYFKDAERRKEILFGPEVHVFYCQSSRPALN